MWLLMRAAAVLGVLRQQEVQLWLPMPVHTQMTDEQWYGSKLKVQLDRGMCCGHILLHSAPVQ
jgi:hypothetical protein